MSRSAKVKPVKPFECRSLNIGATTRLLRDLIADFDSGRIVVPTYQRNSDAWNEARQSGLVYSIVRGYGVPQIILLNDEEGRPVLDDGLQRLTALSLFMKNAFPMVVPIDEEGRAIDDAFDEGDDSVQKPSNTRRVNDRHVWYDEVPAEEINNTKTRYEIGVLTARTRAQFDNKPIIITAGNPGGYPEVIHHEQFSRVQKGVVLNVAEQMMKFMDDNEFIRYFRDFQDRNPGNEECRQLATWLCRKEDLRVLFSALNMFALGNDWGLFVYQANGIKNIQSHFNKTKAKMVSLFSQLTPEFDETLLNVVRKLNEFLTLVHDNGLRGPRKIISSVAATAIAYCFFCGDEVDAVFTEYQRCYADGFLGDKTGAVALVRKLRE